MPAVPSLFGHTRCNSLVIAFLSPFALLLSPIYGAELPEPGPQDGGMRLRWMVHPRSESKHDGYEVRVELLNASDKPIVLQAAWTNEDPGDVKDYLEAATSIETVPAIAPWVGGVEQGMRQSPQPKYTLKANETLRMRWQTDGRKLKNRVTNPNEVQNPSFPFPGLYAVHAVVDVVTQDGPVRLRSNEQLVPVGGNRTMPKYTYGQLWSVDGDNKTAVLGLGSVQKIGPGDVFHVGSPKGMHWKLSIKSVTPTYAVGDLEMLTGSSYPPYREPPPRLMEATLAQD